MIVHCVMNIDDFVLMIAHSGTLLCYEHSSLYISMTSSFFLEYFRMLKKAQDSKMDSINNFIGQLQVTYLIILGGLSRNRPYFSKPLTTADR